MFVDIIHFVEKIKISLPRNFGQLVSPNWTSRWITQNVLAFARRTTRPHSFRRRSGRRADLLVQLASGCRRRVPGFLRSHQTIRVASIGHYLQFEYKYTILYLEKLIIWERFDFYDFHLIVASLCLWKDLKKVKCLLSGPAPSVPKLDITLRIVNFDYEYRLILRDLARRSIRNIVLDLEPDETQVVLKMALQLGMINSSYHFILTTLVIFIYLFLNNVKCWI